MSRVPGVPRSQVVEVSEGLSQVVLSGAPTVPGMEPVPRALVPSVLASLPFSLEFSPGISPSGSALSPFHGQCPLSSLGPSPWPRLLPRAPARRLASLHVTLWFAGCPCVRPACGPSSARCRPGILRMLLLLPPPPKPSSSRKCRQPYPCRGGIIAEVLALNLV